MSEQLEDVYCTLLLNDSYLPGAQVLAHSLRDAGTTKKLAVMVTLDGVSKDTVAELKKVYDYVIPVDPIHSSHASASGNLALMKRPDLNAALTKINVWKQTQFRKIVYLDADTVALRAPDELFDTEADFAAAPDVGWPDCFNSGVMVLSPNVNTHTELTQKAERGESFDGADQGLLNQHFNKHERLPFTYNCTIGADLAYQYAPAFKHYGSNVSVAHFIGDNKPWNRANQQSSSSSSSQGPYDQLSGHWWSVWNKHYSAYGAGSQQDVSHGTSTTYNYMSALSGGGIGAEGGGAPSEQEYLGGPSSGANGASQNQRRASADVSKLAQNIAQVQQLQSNITPVGEVRQLFGGHQPPIGAGHSTVERRGSGSPPPLTHHQQHVVHKRHHDTVTTPEGVVPQEQFFQTGARSYYIQRYDADGKPIPREPRTPPSSSAKDVLNRLNAKMQTATDASDKFQRLQNVNWDAAPKPAPKPKAIFPWEERRRTVTRVFADVIPPANYGRDASDSEDVDNQDTENSDNGSDNEEGWNSYNLRNKWDKDPKIQNYVLGLQQRRKTRSPDGVNTVGSPGKEFTSSPVPATPAPSRRQSSWNDASNTSLPAQDQWDPAKKLEELRQLPRSLASHAIQTEDEVAVNGQLRRARNAI